MKLTERTPEAQAAYMQGFMAGAKWAADRAATELGNAAVHMEVALRDHTEAITRQLTEVEMRMMGLPLPPNSQKGSE